MDIPDRTASITEVRIASPAGTLSARLIRPKNLSGLPPLVVLHGISRNAGELVRLFRADARASGRIVAVPHFSEQRWPHFQRPSDAARPDQALLGLLQHLNGLQPGRIDLFGHSGGAQLAHRFAMLYPQRVGRLNLAAAGWYCLPDATMTYPYGLGTPSARKADLWVGRHRAALPAFLRLPVRLFVGTEDTGRDASLRKTQELDTIQGRTRIDRAARYAASFRAAALSGGITPDITLTRLPGVSHDSAQALTRGNLAHIVCAATPSALARAS